MEEGSVHAAGSKGVSRVDALLEVTAAALALVLLSWMLLRRLSPVSVDLVPLLLLLFVLLAARAWRGGGRPGGPGWRPGRWLAGMAPPGLVMATALLLVLALVPSSGTSLGADGSVYVEQLSDVLLAGRFDTHPGVEPGASVLFAPFFLLGHGAAQWASGSGHAVALDGTSEIHRNALRLGGVAYGFLAMVLAWVACRRFFSPLHSAVCVAGVWLSSTLFHYSVVEPAMAHAPGAATAALLLVLWLRAREESGRLSRWLAVAAAAGALVAIQRYDVYLVLPAFLSGFACLAARWRAGDSGERRAAVLALAAAAAVFLLAASPLILLSRATPGGFLLDPEVIRGAMPGAAGGLYVGEVLFSSNGGLFSWTPIALLGVVGLLILTGRERRVALALLATLALGVVLLSSSPIWWAGWSFGARRFTEAFAIFALGFCATAASALRRPRVLGLVALGGLVAMNLSLSAQQRVGALPPSDSVSFTGATQSFVADLYRSVGHPPSWPANWLFAARYGVSPDRFDDLYGRVPREEWDVRLGRPEDAAVRGRGWWSPRGEAVALQRWALGADATLLFTLGAPVDRVLVLTGAAALRQDRLPQGLALEVGGQEAGRFALAADLRSVRLVLPARLWGTGLNEVRFRPEWALTRSEAWRTGQPAHAAWRLWRVRLGPAVSAGEGP